MTLEHASPPMAGDYLNERSYVARRESTPSAPGSRAVVVDLIRSAGPISRVELTAATGLTQPTISSIVRKLLTDGVVREAGRSIQGVGKPRALVEINPQAAHAVGIQMGFESMTYIATDASGLVVGRRQFEGASVDSPEAVTAQLVERYLGFVESLGIRGQSIAGVALAAPGPIDQPRGLILGPPALRHWHDFGLRAAMQRKLDVPVIIENDAAAAAVGEFWTRQVSRRETFGCIYFGTGIGSGIVLDGALYRGASSNAGELGHISIDFKGEVCFCGNKGCLERYASPSAILEKAEADRDSFGDLDLSFDDHSLSHDFDVLCGSAIEGHGAAAALLSESAAQVAAAAVTMTNLLDLDRIVLAGPGVSVAGSIYRDAMQNALGASAFSRRAHSTVVELSTNPGDSAAIGAAALVLQMSVAPGHSSGVFYS